MKITVELEDTLQERVQSAIDDVKAELLSYLDDNTPDELPDLGNDLDYSGAIHGIIDGAVPVYTREIETAWFLHGSKLERAYDDAGCGNDSRENDGMAAIYFYIQQQVAEWYNDEAEDVFNEWKAKRDAEQAKEEEASK